MKNYARIVTKINSSLWLMTEEGINKCLEILERHMFEDEDEIRRQIGLFDFDANARESYTQIINGVGILSLQGPIFPKANLMTELSGATSLEQFRTELRTLASDPSVHSILVDIDSPGGVSDLVMETGKEIREIREHKPVFTLANTLAASAAFWIASQGTEFYITDSGLTGSLGVYTVHVDDSEAYKKEGILKTVIQAGEAKAGGEQPLNELTRKNLQDTVDATYKDFVDEVAIGRNLSSDFVKENFGKGGVVAPRKALEVGMVDGIKTFESLLGDVGQNGGVVGNASSVVAVKALVNRGIIDKSAIKLFEPDKEHADPSGTGEPIPKEPQMEGDPAVTGGWRVPSDLQPSFPPAEHQPPPTSKIEKRKGSAMDREQLVALANRLGLTFAEDISDDDLFAMITSEVDDVVVPLAQAAVQAEQRRSFETDYPAEASRLRELLQRDEEHEARTFASRWERFSVKDGETTKKSTSGFAARVLGNIEDVHLKLSRKQLQESDIASLLDSIAETGEVDYSEKGSARDVTHRHSISELSIKQIRARFADEVQTVMVDDGVDRKTATRLVAERNPELAEAYKSGHVRR